MQIRNSIKTITGKFVLQVIYIYVRPCTQQVGLDSLPAASREARIASLKLWMNKI